MAVINGSSAVAGAAFEIHWGNVGSFLGGGAAFLLALVAIFTGAAGLQDWRAKVRQQRDLAKEQTRDILLNRRRVLQGWSPHGVATYGVQLVTEPEEMKRAVEELAAREPSEYVVLRVAESGTNVNRAHNLRKLIETGAYLSRPPSAGEYEALEVGRQHLPVPEEPPTL